MAPPSAVAAVLPAVVSVEEAVVAGKVTPAGLTLKIKYEGMKMRLLRRITTLILVLVLTIAATVITPGSASANSIASRPASGQHQQTSPGSSGSSDSSSYSPAGHTTHTNTNTTTPGTPTSDQSSVEPAQPTNTHSDTKAPDDEISDDESSDVDPYVIDAYDVKATVDKYNKLHIEETIKATFNKYRHGIIRTINKVNHVARVDGSKSTVYAIISNIRVSSHSSAVREGGDSTSIKLGSSLTYAKRHEIYRLSYDYDLGTDPLSSSDEFYFNIIGTGWNTNIKKATFRITMPEKFGKKPGFSTGSYGERSGSDIVKYNVNGRVIAGYTTGRLLAGEALTIRLELPQGYFKLDPVKTTIAKFVFIVPVITGIIALALSIMILRKEKSKSTPVIQYTAPDGLNSLELVFANDNTIPHRSAASMVVYLANKGYLTIDIDGENFTLTKLKDYDGKNESERIFMNGLFNNDHPDKVAKAELEGEFYKTVSATISTISRGRLKTKYFEKHNRVKTILKVIQWAAIAILLICAGLATLLEQNPSEALGSMAFIIAFTVFPLFFVLQPTTKQFSPVFTKILCIIVAITPAVVLQALYFRYPTAIVTGISSIFIMIGAYITRDVITRTEDGYRIKGEIMGFKEFIETVDKPRLEALLAETPTLFYDIIPYAYVLDVHKKWVDKFEDIALQPADWYSSSEAFSYGIMASFVTEGLAGMSASFSGFSSVINLMTDSLSDSSGGGSGGGGGSDW
ncbi:DUF2207 domain-containing protein [Candidatus Saccharibacteria bacterium]|nr:DUF2207 domain-containing protein [Candidatus Saccharibacteria bacterium]